MPRGIFDKGIALPTETGELKSEITLVFNSKFRGDNMYLLSPSSYCNKAILAFLFGSYSIEQSRRFP